MKRYIVFGLLFIAMGTYYFIDSRRPPEPGPQLLPGISEAYEAPPPEIAHPDVPVDAWKFYESAKDAVYNSDYALAEKYLSNAVRIKPDFTEAWYNLGATQANRAIDIVRHHGSEAAAVRKFYEAVDSKRKARTLMQQGKWFEYNEQQRAQVRFDVEKALVDADEVLANEMTLIDALRMWAGVDSGSTSAAEQATNTEFGPEPDENQDPASE